MNANVPFHVSVFPFDFVDEASFRTNPQTFRAVFNARLGFRVRLQAVGFIPKP